MTTTLKTLAIALAFGVFAGCAHPDLLKTGMTRDEITARFGQPAGTRHDPDGDVWIYSSAPLGQRASAVHFGADGRVFEVEPVLNTEHFAQIQVGTWTKADVLAHFGRAAEFSGTRQYEVWSYRYREAEVWNSLFHVMFDKEGIVRQTQNAPDPMYEPKDNGRF